MLPLKPQTDIDIEYSDADLSLFLQSLRTNDGERDQRTC